MNRYPLEHWPELGLVLGYLARVPRQETRMQDSIVRVSLIKKRPVSRNIEVTDSWWLRVIVYNALIGDVIVVKILHSTRLSYTLALWGYIFPLVIVIGGRWGLKRDTRHGDK